jgi:hypothetical protein
VAEARADDPVAEFERGALAGRDPLVNSLPPRRSGATAEPIPEPEQMLRACAGLTVDEVRSAGIGRFRRISRVRLRCVKARYTPYRR